MSETSTLIGYQGRTISRQELALIPTPAATSTHVPVPHHEIVQALVETLGFQHIRVTADECAVSNWERATGPGNSVPRARGHSRCGWPAAEGCLNGYPRERRLNYENDNVPDDRAAKGLKERYYHGHVI